MGSLYGHLTVAALGAVVVVATAGTANADCPSRIDDLPPTGFLASHTRAALAPGAPAKTQPAMQARFAVAGGMRAESTDATMLDINDPARGQLVAGSAALGAEIRAHRSGFSGCASADVLDVRDGSAHLTGSAHVPLLFTGLGLGVTLDRAVRLPLSTRYEYHRAPITRVAAQFSSAFLDFDLADGTNGLRISVVPFSVEQGFATQDADAAMLERRTAKYEAAMFRFSATDSTSAGWLDVFSIDVDWTENLTMPSDSGAMGFAKFSPLAMRSDGPVWGFSLDGGILSRAGPVDLPTHRRSAALRGLAEPDPATCDTLRCGRGFYAASLRHTRNALVVEARAERDAFIATDDLPAIEDRLSTTASYGQGLYRASSTAFIAATEQWVTGESGRRAGVRASLSRELPGSLRALVDGEVVHGNASIPEAASGARLLVSLAWQASTER